SSPMASSRRRGLSRGGMVAPGRAVRGRRGWQVWPAPDVVDVERDGPGILGPPAGCAPSPAPRRPGGGRGVHARWLLPPLERGKTMGNMMKARLLAATMALAVSPLLAVDAAAQGRGISSDEAMAVMRSMGLSPDLQ